MLYNIVMDLNIQLTEEAKKAILAGKAWSGRCVVKLEPSIIKAEIGKTLQRKQRQKFFGNPDVKEIIDHWNNHPYLKKGVDENRNKPVTDVKTSSLYNTISLELKKNRKKLLKNYIDTYFESCERGRHIWNGKNVGYKSLDGFIRHLHTHPQDKCRSWWNKDGQIEVRDDDIERTKKIANKYAKIFLGRNNFGLTNSSNSYSKFMTCGKKLDKTAAGFGISLDTALEYLIKCMQQQYDTDVLPGHLSSELTWKVLFPKYLKNLT